MAAGDNFDERTPQEYWAWLRTFFPGYVVYELGPHHRLFWEHVDGMPLSARPPAFVGVWARGGAKSTSGEMAVVYCGARRRRKYCLYVSGTQEQADDHVANIGGMLEGDLMAQYYPALVDRKVGKHGTVRGWRRNRLWTRDGLIVDALGLDTAARGKKLEQQRPDLIVLDDIDDTEDTAETTRKKVRDITRKLIPAGDSHNLAILAIQNLVLPRGVFAALAGVVKATDEMADPETVGYLQNRIVSGPIPAIEDLEYEQDRRGRYVITGGKPTWAGQDLDACQQMLDDMGLTAFLMECQHEVDAYEGGMFGHIEFRRKEWPEDQDEFLAEMDRIVCWVDPAVTSSDRSDSQGIIIDAMRGQVIYRLWSWEGRTTPLEALKMAIRKGREYGVQSVGVETDQGGDTWRSVYQEAARALGVIYPPQFRSAKAGSGHGSKIHRAQQMLADYERGRIVHMVGTHMVLERSLRRFPLHKPYDLTDAAYWGWQDLRRNSFDPDLDVIPEVAMAGTEPYEAILASPWERLRQKVERQRLERQELDV